MINVVDVKKSQDSQAVILETESTSVVMDRSDQFVRRFLGNNQQLALLELTKGTGFLINEIKYALSLQGMNPLFKKSIKS